MSYVGTLLLFVILKNSIPACRLVIGLVYSSHSWVSVLLQSGI